ncbi:hypothetical protein MY04_4771 [Flammeovirga sp. MY04]|uniref:XRE family transcriptional regulator n=1 Tax=Flammeovirga sp. MY04 TaxID=1191459 RepID=UPI0008062D22|nr:S24 family peptidase [Flammeovirga sp. MY04]ANQ49588.1 hypothetical protein MY04_2214 [Flammeovirga sp. MY04]ANQ52106.1 hypothetical protein MY04_4771 [Flammeovirga sp. MY04]
MIENNTNISERIKHFIDSQGFTINQFSNSVGASNSYFNKLFKNKGSIGSDKVEKILRTYPFLNVKWLFTGEGEMLNTGVKQLQPNNELNNGIPLIPINAIAGFGEMDVSITQNDIYDYYNVPDFKGVDFMIRIKGNSMYPKYNSGDIIACKKINNTNIIQWGEIYVVYVRDLGTMVKRLLPSSESKSSVNFVSDNKDYPPFEVPKNDILSLSIILGFIRVE